MLTHKEPAPPIPVIRPVISRLPADKGADRRSEPRFSVRDEALLRALNPSFQDRIAATIIDISKNGLRCRMPVRLYAGTSVQIVLKKKVVIVGKVRFSKTSAGGFEHGIAIESTFHFAGQ